jgi:hypothetical protein
VSTFGNSNPSLEIYSVMNSFIIRIRIIQGDPFGCWVWIKVKPHENNSKLYIVRLFRGLIIILGCCGMLTVDVVTADPHSPDFTPPNFFVLGFVKIVCGKSCTVTDD